MLNSIETAVPAVDVSHDREWSIGEMEEAPKHDAETFMDLPLPATLIPTAYLGSGQHQQFQNTT
jgi:hypothetical protein